MQIKEIVDTFLEKYPLKGENAISKLGDITVNCVSLTEAWKHRSGDYDGSLSVSTYDSEGLLIDTIYGNSWETIPVELMNICLNRSTEVKTARVFSYANVDGELKSNLIGSLDVV